MQDSPVSQLPLGVLDVLIVGAGPAGCAAAYDLASSGKRVLLLDKRNFPRHKACACGLTRKTLAALRYSVDPIIERVCHEIVLQIGDPRDPNQPSAPNPARLPAADKSREVRIKTRNPICALAVRERFDHFCLQQTLASARSGGSVHLRKIDHIAALREFPDHIELDVATPGGIETLRAPALIGADGSNGQTRRLTLQPSLRDADGFALEATVPYASLPATLPAGDAPHDLVFDFSPLRGGYGWLFPKGDHINIGVGAFAPGSSAPNTQLKSVTRQLLFDYALQKLGITTLPHITGQQLGMGGHTYIPRGRVLLVGDAAGLVDPLTGEGIHSAILSGQASASAILKYSSKNYSNKKYSDKERRKESSKDSGTPPPSPETSNELATLYAKNLRPLQQTLAFSHRAARAFYAQPERGFKAMRSPLLRSLILKTYADGLPHTQLLTTLSRLIT